MTEVDTGCRPFRGLLNRHEVDVVLDQHVSVAKRIPQGGRDVEALPVGNLPPLPQMPGLRVDDPWQTDHDLVQLRQRETHIGRGVVEQFEEDGSYRATDCSAARLGVGRDNASGDVGDGDIESHAEVTLTPAT